MHLLFLVLCFSLLSCLPFRQASLEQACNPNLNALTKDAFESVADVELRLSELERFLLSSNDVRASFVSTYLLVTQQVKTAIDFGFFEDGVWLSDITVSFANAYRDAFWTFECADRAEVTEAWRFSFEAESPLLAALLGVNAHINYDLPYTLESVGLKDKAISYADHTAVNVLLKRSINAIEDKLSFYSPELKSLDEAFGPLEEDVLMHWLVIWREQAWRHALQLEAADSDLDNEYLDWLIASYARNTAEHLHALLALAPF